MSTERIVSERGSTSAPAPGHGVPIPAEASPPPHLQVHDLGYRFSTEGSWAVRGLNFDVARGEFFGLLGASGSGKSTTLNLLAGFLIPTEGDILVANWSLAATQPHKRGMALVFQDYALFPHLSAADNVAFGLRLRHQPREQVKRRVAELLGLVGLSHRAAHLPQQLSGGEQQRVAVARALATEPEVVLLDEPFSNLDARLRVQMRRELKRILSEARVTTIFVTHDQAEAFSVCDRVALLRRGRIEDAGTPDRMYARPATRAAAEFVGEANFFAARVVMQERDKVEVEIEGISTAVFVRVAEPLHPSIERGVLMVRPESVELSTSRPDGPHLETTVRGYEFEGPLVRYELRSGPGRIAALVHSSARRLEIDERVYAAWAEPAAVFFPEADTTG